MRVVTGNEALPVSVEDHLRTTLRIDKFDSRPTFLYFHQPHGDGEDTEAAKTSSKQCRVLDDEQIARWCNLYRCIEVEMEESDPRMVERLGGKEGVTFAVVDPDLNVLATSGPLGTAKAVVGFLKATVTTKAEKWWTEVQKRVEEQSAILKQARALAAQKKWKEALEQYDQIRKSDVRIADWWDDAVADARKAERKLDEK